jgi:UDP-glucose 4-epimerase
LKILVTGAAGYIGSNLLKKISNHFPAWNVLGADIRPILNSNKDKKNHFIQLDISNREDVIHQIKKFKPNSIVHLASILNPPPGMSESLQRKIDVEGTRNIIDGAILAKCEQVIITSSGAAYGYHRDNPEWLKETDPIRGHDSFAYSRHKKEVEELLENYRRTNPGLKQLILRPGTVLGPTVNNLITDIFKKPITMGIYGSKSPFVFIWDEDVINIILMGIEKKKFGIYNLAGDGAIPLPEIAKILKKPYIPIPAFVLKTVLYILKQLHLSQYEPAQIDFLRYRPVLSNDRLKSEFGYTPKFTSKQAFFEFLKAKGIQTNENN